MEGRASEWKHSFSPETTAGRVLGSGSAVAAAASAASPLGGFLTVCSTFKNSPFPTGSGIPCFLLPAPTVYHTSQAGDGIDKKRLPVPPVSVGAECACLGVIRVSLGTG